MTKKEAIAALDNGAVITHVNFDLQETVKKVGNEYVFEDGHSCTPEEFWRWRTNHSWDEGYEVIA